MRTSALRFVKTNVAKVLSAEAPSVQTDVFQPATSANSSWSLLPSPKLVVPSFELTRSLGNLTAESTYRAFLEKTYTREGFLNAAMQASTVCAHYIADSNWDGLARIVTKDTVDKIKKAREQTPDVSANLLRFGEDDILCSFLYSAMYSGRNMFKLSESGNMYIYFTAVTYIRLNENVPREATPKQILRKYKSDCLFANITLARAINPLGIWKATAVNYFREL